MEKYDIVVALYILLIAIAALRVRRDMRRPRAWARSWIRRWTHCGAHHSLMKKLAAEDDVGAILLFFSGFMFLRNT